MQASSLGSAAHPQYSDDAFERLYPQPMIAGSIRTTPEDFRVTEHLPFQLSGHGEHVYVEIEKRGANSGWVAHKLAEFAGVQDVDVGFAGRKDRHAITRQWFSLYLPKKPEIDWQRLDIEGVELLSVGQHSIKLRRGDIRCNEFNINVYHPELSDEQQHALVARLESIATNGVPNYFGSQRFGRDGQNLQKADQLLRFRQKAPKNKGMLISAARSWLFNGYLSHRLQTKPEGMTELHAENGPLIGKSRDPQVGEELFDEVEQAWAEGIRRLGTKVDERKLIVIPDELRWTLQPTTTRLQFELPSGSFATSVLRELFVVEDLSVREQEA